MVDASKFLQSVSDHLRLTDDAPDLTFLPDAIASACVDVLPVTGAGLSVISDLRLPLGSSDADATFMERLQFSLGEGPCLAASAARDATVNDHETISARWPVFATEMTTRTPYRSVISLPIVLAGYRGALNLYSDDPITTGFPPLIEVINAVAAPINVLASDPPTTHSAGLDLPVWMATEAVSLRLDLWLAVGMIMENRDCPSSDALAVLRGYAFSRSSPVDQVSRQLVDGLLRPAEIAEV